MAKKNKHRNGKKMTIPIAVVAGMIPGLWRVGGKWSQGFGTMANEAGRVYLGYDSWTGQWNMGSLKFGLAPLIGGFVVHKIASIVGINKMIARTGIPLIRL